MFAIVRDNSKCNVSFEDEEHCESASSLVSVEWCVSFFFFPSQIPVGPGVFVLLRDPHRNDRDLLVEVRVLMRASLHPLDSLEPVDDTSEARVGVVVALSAGTVQLGIVLHVDVEIWRGWTSGKAQRPFTVGEVFRIFLEHGSRERGMDEPVIEVDTRWSGDGVRFGTTHQDVRCVPVERRPIVMLHAYLVQEPVHGVW